MEDKRIFDLRKRIGCFPDFPKKGVTFRDIFPIFNEPSLLPIVIDLFSEKLANRKVDVFVGIDSRGFLIAPQLSVKFGCSFVPARKKGKLPGATISQSYLLEYGEDSVEMQEGAIKEGQNVVIVDDLIATGGTMSAVNNLVLKFKANVVCCMCVIELSDLNGWRKLPSSTEKISLLQYKGE